MYNVVLPSLHASHHQHHEIYLCNRDAGSKQVTNGGGCVPLQGVFSPITKPRPQSRLESHSVAATTRASHHDGYPGTHSFSCHCLKALSGGGPGRTGPKIDHREKDANAANTDRCALGPRPRGWTIRRSGPVVNQSSLKVCRSAIGRYNQFTNVTGVRGMQKCVNK